MLNNQSDFTPQQIAAAIRSGLREGRRPVDLSPTEAEVKAETYLANLAHFQQHVRTSLDAGDYLQAAEKSWGAYAQTIKAISADHLLSVAHHASLIGVAGRLAMLARASDSEAGNALSVGLSSARSLHQHFYESDLPPEEVVINSTQVETAIDLMQQLFSPNGAGNG